MNIERDKFLTEAMGECWHERRFPNQCSCGKKLHSGAIITGNNDFSTWDCFGKLWNWSHKQEWWALFRINYVEVIDSYIHPDRFADAVYEFLKESEK